MVTTFSYVEAVVKYVYTGVLTLNTTSVYEILTLAKSIQATQVTRWCIKFLIRR